jgi:hypothetical protein
VLVIYSVEKRLDVRFDHPPAMTCPKALTNRFQRIVRASTGPKAVGSIDELGLVHGFKHHRHGTLQDFVLECRDPERTTLSVALRNVHASDRRSSVTTRLELLQQLLQVAPQIGCVVSRCRAVYSRGAVLAG